jgi:hypothetical protein
MSILFSTLTVLALAAALATVPFGVPGVWLMTAILLAATLLGAVAWSTWLILAAAPVAAARMPHVLQATAPNSVAANRIAVTSHTPGTPNATVANAAARARWGTLLARTGAVMLKVGVGSVILAVGAWELLS